MNQSEHLKTPQSNEPLSQNAKSTQQQSGDTIDACTMDPCPMKEKNKSEHAGKCPDCGNTERGSGVKK
ncbi:hypothetical protein CAP36_12020 [Chitinophagaceae bacterium IBVUCB2]|nr:hypothetical protein CAP36_12020 [Chitinophagaceae bacterium IBVUCB2]